MKHIQAAELTELVPERRRCMHASQSKLTVQSKTAYFGLYSRKLLMITTETEGESTLSETLMTGVQLHALMTENTVYLTEPNGGGEIVLWYGADGRAMSRLPSAMMLDGTWSIKGDRSCIVWSYSPKDSCSEMFKVHGRIELREAGTGRLLGTVRSIVPGNSEGL